MRSGSLTTTPPKSTHLLKEVRAIHDVPGRVRLQVAGLRGDALLKEVIETLSGRSGIHAASASVVTGNVLIYFDPERRLPEIIGVVRVILEHPRPKRTARPGQSASPAGVWSWLTGLFGSAPEHAAVSER